jgi:hypothetical protein
MRKVLLAAAVLAVSLSMAVNAGAYTKEMVRYGGETMPEGLSQDCTLQAYNLCACWLWVFTEAPGAVWGTVYDPNDCDPACGNGGAVSEIFLYSRCDVAPGQHGGVGVSTVDANNCLVDELWNSGPFTTFSCVAGDRITTIDVPIEESHVNGERFAVTVTWGDGTAQLGTEATIAALFCSFGVIGGFPGCATSTCTCTGWTLPTANTFLWVSDFTGDTIPDDICDLYGYPYALGFPYYPGYGYLYNNLMISVGLDCTSPTAVEPTSWGHVKALYE